MKDSKNSANFYHLSLGNTLRSCCNAFIEVGWLAILIVIPLFFNPYSCLPFKDKYTLAQAVSYLMLCIWLIKVVVLSGLFTKNGITETKKNFRYECHRKSVISFISPLFTAIFLFLLSNLISTVLSISPQISWTGYYLRPFGLYTTCSYLIVFLMILSHLRSCDQLQRMLYAIVLTGFSVSLVAIAQIGWSEAAFVADKDSSYRVFSTIGNPITNAAYLIFTFFITLSLFVSTFVRLTEEIKYNRSLQSRFNSMFMVFIFFFILCTHVIAIMYTQSRGPIIGLTTGLFFFLLSLLNVYKQYKQENSDKDVLPGNFSIFILLFLFLSISLIIIFYFTIPLSDSLTTSQFHHMYSDRLNSVFNITSLNESMRFKSWEEVMQFFINHNPIEDTWGNKDRFTALRALAGYGPATLILISSRFISKELSGGYNVDTMHNVFFDTLFSRGWFGLAVTFLLFYSIFHYAMEKLGFLTSGKERKLFLLIFFVLSLCGIMFLIGTNFSPPLQILIFPVSLAGSIFVYQIFCILFKSRDRGNSAGNGLSRNILLSGLFSSIISHFVEIQTGVPSPPTQSHFWIFLAIFIVIANKRLSMQQTYEPVTDETKGMKNFPTERNPTDISKLPVTNTSGEDRNTLFRDSFIYALLTFFVFITLTYDYMTNSGGLTNPFGLITTFFSEELFPGESVKNSKAITIFLIVLTLSLFLFMHKVIWANKTYGIPACLKYLAVFTGTVIVFFMLFTNIHAGYLAKQTILSQDSESFLSSIHKIADFVNIYYIFLLLVFLFLTVTIAKINSLQYKASFIKYPKTFVAILLIIPLILFSNKYLHLDRIKAECYCNAGLSFLKMTDSLDFSLFAFDKAIKLRYGNDFYYYFHGKAAAKKAITTKQNNQTDYWFELAVSNLKKAQEINSFNIDRIIVYLGRIYFKWSTMSQSRDERMERINKSFYYYKMALRLDRRSAYLFDETGRLYMHLGDHQKALEYYNEALSIEPDFVNSFIGKGSLFMLKAQYAMEAKHIKKVNAMLERALYFYEKALALDKKSVDTYRGIGYIHAFKGNHDGAIDAYNRLLLIDSEHFEAHLNLSTLYKNRGETKKALNHAQRAYEFAPDEKKREITDMITELHLLIKKSGSSIDR